uniref:restriction endonuclease subunit S n=1 Tax=Psychrobacter sp. CAL346-MNA-CIBAN-0220 TaxID=3140457 RepID=UPI00332D4821
PIHEGNVITVNYNGSVGESFYQPLPFWASDDVNVLYPRECVFPYFNAYIALFVIPLIKIEQFRFNYGRKWHTDRMNDSSIRLPIDKDGSLNLRFMEGYIKSLPFSSSIE